MIDQINQETSKQTNKQKQQALFEYEVQKLLEWNKINFYFSYDFYSSLLDKNESREITTKSTTLHRSVRIYRILCSKWPQLPRKYESDISSKLVIFREM